MPTISNSNLPTPKSWDEFEEITLDALKIKWDNPDLVRYGRSGQAQQGVDIYGNDYFFRMTGVQCKKYDIELTLKVVQEEIAKAEKFQPTLTNFFFATTQPTDAKLQKQIRLLTKDRVSAGKFPVGIFFWNDLVQEIITSDVLLKKHFPQFNAQNLVIKPSKKLYSILDLSFYGLNVNHYADVILGELGQMAQEDPYQMEVVTSIINSASLAVLREDESVQIISATKEYMVRLKPFIAGQKASRSSWNFARDVGPNLEINESNRSFFS